MLNAVKFELVLFILHLNCPSLTSKKDPIRETSPNLLWLRSEFSANLPVVLLVPFLPMVTVFLLPMIHGGIFIILMNTCFCLSYLLQEYCVIFNIYICMYDKSIAYLRNS